MSSFNKDKILEIDSFVKAKLVSVFDKPFNLISYSVIDNNTLKLHYTYGSDNIKVLLEVTDSYKITELYIHNPSNNNLSNSYVTFCSKLVDLDFLGYTEFQKIEAQTQMIIPLDVEHSIKNIGKTSIKSTYTGPNEDISATIKILD